MVDLRTGAELKSWLWPGGSSKALALSPDGRRALVGTQQGATFLLFDLDQGGEMRTFTGHQREVTGLAFSADGKWAGSASLDQTVRVWNVETGQQLVRSQGNTGNPEQVGFSGDGRRVWTCGGNTADLGGTWIGCCYYFRDELGRAAQRVALFRQLLPPLARLEAARPEKEEGPPPVPSTAVTPSPRDSKGDRGRIDPDATRLDEPERSLASPGLREGQRERALLDALGRLSAAREDFAYMTDVKTVESNRVSRLVVMLFGGLIMLAFGILALVALAGGFGPQNSAFMATVMATVLGFLGLVVVLPLVLAPSQERQRLAAARRAVDDQLRQIVRDFPEVQADNFLAGG